MKNLHSCSPLVLLVAVYVLMPVSAAASAKEAFSREDLVFAWLNRTTVPKIEGAAEPFDFQLKEDTWYDENDAAVFRGGYGAPNEAALKRLQSAVAENSEMSVEFEVSAAAAKGEQTLLSVTRRDGTALFSIVQKNQEWLVQAGKKSVKVGEVLAGKPQYLALVLQAGTLRTYMNGKASVSIKVDDPVGVAGIQFSPDESARWRGTVANVLVTASAVSPARIAEYYEALKTEWGGRKPLPRIVVDAELLSTVNEVDDAYPRALVNFIYKVTKVVDGEYKEENVQVYHWGKLGFADTPFMKREVGKVYRLVLVPMDRIPHMNEVERVDNDDYDFRLTDYFDASQ